MIRHRHFNISSQGCGPLAAVACAPGEGVPPLPPSSGGEDYPVGANGNGARDESIGVIFSPHMSILLQALAAHDRCADIGTLIVQMIEERARQVGVSSLFRAAVDHGSALPDVITREPKKGREEVPSGLLPVPRAPP